MRKIKQNSLQNWLLFVAHVKILSWQEVILTCSGLPMKKTNQLFYPNTLGLLIPSFLVMIFWISLWLGADSLGPITKHHPL